MAHKLQAAQEVWRPAARWALGEGWKVRWANGEQCVETPDGSRWLIQAATDGAGVSFSLSMALVDEAWRVKREVVDGAIGPTLAEAEQPQLWLVSTAGDSTSDLMLAYREQALAGLGDGSGPLLLEWSAPEGTDPGDVGAARSAQAHWDERRARTLAEKRGSVSRAEFESQWLNVWQAHPMAAPGELLFGEGSWVGCRVRGLRPGSLADVRVAVVEDDFGRGGAVALAWWDTDGRPCVWADAMPLPRCWEQVAGVGRVLAGLSLRDTQDAVRVGGVGVGARELGSALSVARGLVDDGSVRWDGPDLLTGQGDRVRVRRGAGNVLALGPGQEVTVLRALLFAVGDLLSQPRSEFWVG